MLNFTASNPNGYKSEIRSTGNDHFSVFTWHDAGAGVVLWNEQHDLDWEDAMFIATNWLSY